MDIDQSVVTAGEVDRKIKRLNTVLARKFKMRDSADCIGTHLDRVFHQLASVGEAHNSLLGEGDDLDVYQLSQFFSQFKHGLECHQLGICDIDMSADMLDAISCLHAYSAAHTLLDVRSCQSLLALAPEINSLKQRAAPVPVRLTCGQAGIKMNMRLDKRRQREFPAVIDDFFAGNRQQSRSDLRDQAILNSDVSASCGVFNI